MAALDLSRVTAEPGIQPTRPAWDGLTSGFVSRSRRALERSRRAWECLHHCTLCAHCCGANRWKGETGPCHAGTEARVFHAQTEVADERDLAPVFVVAFSGCDLRCDFCNIGRESWNPQAGTPLAPLASSPSALSSLALRLTTNHGLMTIN